MEKRKVEVRKASIRKYEKKKYEEKLNSVFILSYIINEIYIYYIILSKSSLF